MVALRDKSAAGGTRESKEMIVRHVTWILACFLASSAVAATVIPRSFNADAFTGLAKPTVESYDDTVLDIELDNASGTPIRFEHCRQVETTPEHRIAPSQYSLFRLLTVNCLAARQFAGSQSSTRSYFPKRLTKRIVARFPATAVPKLSEEDMLKRTGRRLSAYERKATFSVPNDGTVIAQTKNDEFHYTLMARGDFNDDGLEDWLVRGEWRARDAQGQGVDLFLLTRRSRSGSVVLVWRP